MANSDPASSPTPDELQQQAAYERWRAQVAARLLDAGRFSEGINFGDCGKLFGNFNVAVCDEHPEHEARALPFTCHLRYCPDCERRHQAEQVAKYTPILKDIAENSDRSGWSLKKIVLTTPYSLESDGAADLYQQAWEFFEDWQQLVFQKLLQHEMSPAEKRRGRIDYAKHGLGSLVSAEFGEGTHHLHFHILAYCPFVPKHFLSNTWAQASDGVAFITDIREIKYHDVDNAVREQVKYVTKFTELQPALVVKLADVLDGSRRLRTYGLVRKAKKLEKEACTCKYCQSKISIMTVRAYFEICIDRNIEINNTILDAARRIFLDLKHGNNSGEVVKPTARSDPDEPPAKQADLPGFDTDGHQKPKNSYYRTSI